MLNIEVIFNSLVCRCDVLRVFAQTNFIACIMSAACVLLSGELPTLLPKRFLKHAAAGELRPSFAAFQEQPMCLAFLIAMNIFLCVPLPAALLVIA
jgi:hypothetical protein